MFRRITAMLLLICLMLSLFLFADAETVKLAYKTGTLALRKGAGTAFEVVDYLKNGDKITVLEKGGTWSKVKAPSGKTGYIKNLYISGNGTEYAAGTTYMSSARDGRVVTSSAARMRAGASMTSSSICTLKNGQKVTVLGSNGAFYLVATPNGEQGYVHKSLVYVGAATEKTPSSAKGSAKYAMVTASSLIMRSGQGTQYNKIISAPYGSKVTVLSSSSKWWRVQYKGKTGYMWHGYLKML